MFRDASLILDLISAGFAVLYLGILLFDTQFGFSRFGLSQGAFMVKRSLLNQNIRPQSIRRSRLEV